MVDRVSARITIGGALPSALLPDFIALIEQQSLSIEWDGEAFDVSDLRKNAALELMAHEVAWGRFDELEAFCVKNALPFSRWSGACSGQWGAERVVFTGGGEPQSYATDEDDYILIGRCMAERLGGFAAIIAHFNAANVVIPPLVIG